MWLRKVGKVEKAIRDYCANGQVTPLTKEQIVAALRAAGTEGPAEIVVTCSAIRHIFVMAGCRK